MQVAGAEVLVAEIIRRLRDSMEPTIFCLDAIGPLGKALQDEGVDVVCLNRKPGRDWGVGKRLAAVAKEKKIEVMHAHQYTPFFYSALAKAWGGANYKLILTEHGRHFPDAVSFKRRLANRWVLSRYLDAINACCQFSATALASNDGFTTLPIEVIENGIEWERYQTHSNKTTLRASLGLDANRKYVACVARFHPIKDHTSLLQGYSQVAKQRTDADLLLIGDGPRREELQTLVQQLGIQNRVQFLGVRSDVADLLQAVDVFALTSLCEAASLTLLEAMAAGLPVVVTDVGGNPEIVRQENEGLLVPRQDATAIGNALIRILSDATLANRMGQAGKQRVKETYSLERTIERYHQLYQRLANQ
jgi:N-acetyl-alpha-D-glucosaminyl L-malate synthase BshA